MDYATLTFPQQAQAEQLFFDQLFGTDPARFDYELDRAGNVAGRIPLVKALDRKHYQARGAASQISWMRAEPTAEAHAIRERALDDLARAVAFAICQTPVAVVGDTTSTQ